MQRIKLDTDELIKRAPLWTIERGNRSRRVARQFIEHLLGKLGTN
ncbi:MAG: DUF815 domain-containing protein [Hyphomicrobiales bacterium]